MKIPVSLSARAAVYSPRVLYGISCATILILLLSWWMFVYRYTQRLIDGYAAYNGSCQTQCNNAVSCTQSLRGMQQRVSQLRQDLEHRVSDAQFNWMVSVINSAKSAGLSMHSYQADAECAKNWYRCARARFEFGGTLDQIINFVSQLTRHGIILGCKQWSLVRTVQNTYTFSCLLQCLTRSECACSQERKTPST